MRSIGAATRLLDLGPRATMTMLMVAALGCSAPPECRGGCLETPWLTISIQHADRRSFAVGDVFEIVVDGVPTDGGTAEVALTCTLSPSGAPPGLATILAKCSPTGAPFGVGFSDDATMYIEPYDPGAYRSSTLTVTVRDGSGGALGSATFSPRLHVSDEACHCEEWQTMSMTIP